MTYNPHEYLKSEGIAKSLLSPESIKALDLFDKAAKIHNDFPSDTGLKAKVKQMGEMAIKKLRPEVQQLTKNLIDEEHEIQKKEKKKVQSKKVLGKANETLDDLALCRKKLKEDRQRKVESGQIKPPKKKTTVEKLRSEVLKMADLIPSNMKNRAGMMDKTKKALLTFLAELKGIWGLNVIKPIREDLIEKFKKLEDKDIKKD